MIQGTIAPGRACEHCGLEVTTCKGCGAEIIFGTSTMGKPWPLDAKVTIVAVRLDHSGRAFKRFWTTAKGHVPHHFTCPMREAFSR